MRTQPLTKEKIAAMTPAQRQELAMLKDFRGCAPYAAVVAQIEAEKNPKKIEIVRRNWPNEMKERKKT